MRGVPVALRDVEASPTNAVHGLVPLLNPQTGELAVPRSYDQVYV